MRRIFTTFVAGPLGLLAAAQVLTVNPNGHVYPASGLGESERAILLPALQSATGDASPDLLKSFSTFKEPLSEPGARAIIAISLKNCGEHQNCQFFVFRRHGSADDLILDSVAGDWDLKDTRHHGFRDIVLTNYRGIHQMVSTWQFDGRRYRVSACIDQITVDGARNIKPADQCGT